MEMLAKDFMVEPAFLDLNERYGSDNILPVCYMNTSGRVKAMTGAQGGAVCTSSNVKKIFQWAQKQNKNDKICTSFSVESSLVVQIMRKQPRIVLIK